MDNEPSYTLPPGEQELAITRILTRRLDREECLRASDRQSVAYRVAEIMVAARNLYTEVLPRLTGEEASDYDAFEDLAGLRMALLNLRDLIEGFEEIFMDSMANQREDDGLETEADAD